MSRTNYDRERLEIILAENGKLRRQNKALVEELADLRVCMEALEESVVALQADKVLLTNKLKAKQMHLDAMNDPKTAVLWHERYIKEILR